jgi:hypothetical protein
MEVHVFTFCGDFTDKNHPAAVITMRVRVFNTGEDKSGHPVLAKDYSSRIPLKEKTAAAVMAGWDTGLNEIMASIISDMNGLK